ncbi:AAA family ATPase [Streptomyces sp. NPDC001795]|uniref:AAA family ATPase n=1 Tax=Streptomyces sp. NPDC001795 TaxID=3154525 RepID=UPI003325DD60
MLTLDRLTVEDFGPYRGRQEMVFSSDRGVYIVYGPNGRGKTTLHNAFRYALYGEIHGRRGAEEASDLVNTEARKEAGGVGAFETVLDFHEKGVPYRLIRRYDEGTQPNETIILQRDGEVLSPDDSRRIIQMIAPESVSQFFLFDGELLRQYEDLLDPRSEKGAELERSIERVLGIPIVGNAKADAVAISRAASKQMSEQYAANHETNRMGLALKEAQDVRDRFQRDYSEIESQIEAGQNRISELDVLMREQQKAQHILGKIDQLELQIAGVEGREKAAIAALDELSTDLWKAVLARSATERLAEVDGAVAMAETELSEAAAAMRDLTHLHAGNDCPVCRREIPPALHAELTEKIKQIASTGHQEDVQTRLDRLRAKRRTLQTLAQQDVRLIVERDANLRQVRLEKEELYGDIAELRQQIDEIGQSEEQVRALSTERDERHAKLERDKDRLAALAEQIRKKEADIEDFKRRLRKQVPPDRTVELKDEVAQRLRDLFSDSIDAYRTKLRRRVEKHASEIFRVLASEPDYVGLRITDSYGLEILDKDGEVVRRSAGYEHLVALSLIAALQDSAAVRGPVVMDYPFGRLDTDNTAHVVAALPRMARQVILLSFDGEFDRAAALQALGSNLVAEYQLERRSSKHTVIERRRAAV